MMHNLVIVISGNCSVKLTINSVFFLQKIRWSSTQDHNSEAEELLTLWGEQNHTVTELFVLLSRLVQ